MLMLGSVSGSSGMTRSALVSGRAMSGVGTIRRRRIRGGSGTGDGIVRKVVVEAPVSAPSRQTQ